MKKLIFLLAFVAFAKISSGTCSMHAVYYINSTQVVSVPPYGHSVNNIYINNGDSVEFWISASAPWPCSCSLENILWTYNGVVFDSVPGCVSGTHHTVYNPGEYKLTLIFDGTLYCSHTFNVNVNLLSITDNSLQNILNVSPNPFKNNLSVSIQKSNIKQLTFSVHNILGHQVFTQLEKSTSSVYQKEIDLSNLLKGIYFLQANVDGQRIVRKIIKE